MRRSISFFVLSDGVVLSDFGVLCRLLSAQGTEEFRLESYRADRVPVILFYPSCLRS